MTSDHFLPRINFAPDLIDSIISGSKTATTRLADENDPDSDLDLISVGCKFSATSQFSEYRFKSCLQRHQGKEEKLSYR